MRDRSFDTRGWLLGCAALALGAMGCGGDTAAFPTDPVDVEVLNLAITHGMTVDPRQGRDLPAPEDPIAQLGMRLFFSKSLGADRDAACVTCHHPVLGGGDRLTMPIGVEAVDPDLLGPGRRHRATGTAFDGGPTVPRNAPTTFNLGLLTKTLLHDGRIQDLLADVPGTPALIRTPDVAFGASDPRGGEDLAMALARFPTTVPEELKGHSRGAMDNQQLREYLAGRLGGYGLGGNELPDPGFWLEHFRTAFGQPNATAQAIVTEANIARALGAYMRSQVFVDSPWSQFLAGQYTALAPAAKRGALLFLRPGSAGGKGCVACHSGELFTDQSFATTAVPQLGRGKGDGASGRQDLGRGRESGAAADAHAFRVPSLLNVAATGPWGHSGAYTSLGAMVRHYRSPATAAQTYDATQLTQPGIQNLATVVADTAPAAAKVLADRATAPRSLPDTPITDAEVAEIVAFLEALTDPCVKDPECLSRWIPDATTGVDPNGDQLNARFAP